MKLLAPDTVGLNVPEFEKLIDPERASELAARIAQAAPGLIVPLAAVAEPELVVRCLLGTPEASAEYRIYAQPEAAAVFFYRTDPELGESFELSAVAPLVIPALIARIVRLGPRHQQRSKHEIDAAFIDDLFSSDAMLRHSALQALDADWAWSAEVYNLSDDVRSLTAIDGKKGLALINQDDHGTSINPTTATYAFEVFTTVFN